MSVYNRTDKPAYEIQSGNSNDASNPYILKWWTKEDDNIILELIKKYQWQWYWEISDTIIKRKSEVILDNWKNRDPLCKQYAWYNVLMYFAIARAEQLNYNQNIRKAIWKKCLICKKKFIEDSLPFKLLKRIGIDNIIYCSPCLTNILIYNGGKNNATEKQVKTYIKGLVDVFKVIPTQDMGQGNFNFENLTESERKDLVKLLEIKPTMKHIKNLYGSWLNALIKTEILEGNTRRTSRGTQTIAKDGHVCLSLGEKTIDDFFYENNIIHEREPKYPESNYRVDFKINDTYLEYFGLLGNTEYDEKIKLKKNICKKFNIELIEIYPKDLIAFKKFEEKVKKLFIYKKR